MIYCIYAHKIESLVKLESLKTRNQERNKTTSTLKLPIDSNLIASRRNITISKNVKMLVGSGGSGGGGGDNSYYWISNMTSEDACWALGFFYHSIH